jgi:hypothetical protein
LEAQKTTNENMSDFVTYLRNMGDSRQENLKYDEGWIYVFDDKTVDGLKIVWKMPEMIKNNLSIGNIQLDPNQYVDLDLYLGIIPKRYIGEYLSKNLTVKEIATYIKNIRPGWRVGQDSYVLEIIEDSLGEYWGETGQLDKIGDFRDLMRYIMTGAYSFYPEDIRTAVNKAAGKSGYSERYSHSNPTLNPDRIIRLLKEDKISPEDALTSPELGKYPEEYFNLVKKYYKEKKRQELYAKMAPVFEEYGYTLASDIADEMIIRE